LAASAPPELSLESTPPTPTRSWLASLVPPELKCICDLNVKRKIRFYKMPLQDNEEAFYSGRGAATIEETTTTELGLRVSALRF
jgi:hypothetical protein